MRPAYSEITCEDMASYLWCLSIHPGNIYRKGWTDDTTPRTDRPVRFTVQTYDGEYLNPLRPLRHA